nr:EOG090X03T7 [Scapholeberis mucronata]
MAHPSFWRNLELVLFIVLLLELSPCSCLHLTGSWTTSTFFHFLAKFGFQKTNLKDRSQTQGYIYGNVTTQANMSHFVTLAVLDRGYFLEYYGNSSMPQKKDACNLMFNRIDTVAYDSQCNDGGSQDLLRKIPCHVGQLCVDEDNPKNVVANFQFSFHVEDLSQPRFWYVSFVACYRDLSTNCSWRPYEGEIKFDYDIWLVNGNPQSKNQNPLEYQFSFDNQDTVEIYLVFLTCYLFLTPLQVYAVMRQKHPVPKLFTAGLLTAVCGLLLNVFHCLKFAFDGQGFETAAIIGGALDICSQTLLMLLLLLLAKGWAITRKELSWRPLLFSVWAFYGLIHVLLYVWDLTEIDVIDDVDAYQTWPGWLMLISRICIMAWFLFCLRATMAYEHQKSKLDFFLHFGAASLVWFIYLPIVALVALQVPVLWRTKLLLGIVHSANFLAYAVMAHLLWPTRSQQYFLLANEFDLGDELDEFDEAPHNLSNRHAQFMRKNSRTSNDSDGFCEEAGARIVV